MRIYFFSCSAKLAAYDGGGLITMFLFHSLSNFLDSLSPIPLSISRSRRTVNILAICPRQTTQSINFTENLRIMHKNQGIDKIRPNFHLSYQISLSAEFHPYNKFQEVRNYIRFSTPSPPSRKHSHCHIIHQCRLKIHTIQ